MPLTEDYTVNHEVRTMGFRVFNAALSEVALTEGRTLVLNTISPNSYGMSTKDEEFRTALVQSDILVLDGVYFALAALALRGKRIMPNQGPTVFEHFMTRMSQSHGRVFFFGSTPDTLEKMKVRARADFPGAQVAYYSPPFRAKFTDREDEESLAHIQRFRPDIVFVSLTCPKQEKWVHQHRSAINAKLVCSVGAVFDWYSGKQKEIPNIWWKYKLAWLKRTIDRPEILKRYPNIGIFFRDLLLELTRKRRSDRNE